MRYLRRQTHHLQLSSIGKIAGLDPNTNSQILKGLQQKKLIKRDQSDDKRAKNVSLTPKGSQILSSAMPALEEAEAKFFHLLKESEITLLTEIFQTLMTQSLVNLK